MKPATSHKPLHQRYGDRAMIGFFGDNYLILALGAAALFMAVVGFVSIEDAFRRH